MMKFFRKYTKHLLAVFMALLLVVWLGSTPLTNWLGRHNRQENYVRGTLDGKEVRQSEVLPTFQEIEVLKESELQRVAPWQAVWFSVLRQLGVDDQKEGLYDYLYKIAQARDGEPLNEDEWFLLLTEARRNGIFIPSEEVQSFKERHGLVGPALRRLRQHFSLKLIDDAIRSFLMVQQQAVAACKAPPVSEADINEFVRKVCEKADVTLVTLSASDKSKFYDPSYEPSESELATLFDKYKNTASQPYGLNFGYQQAEEVQIEYIRIDAAALQKEQVVTEDTAFDYWERHQKEFTRPVASQPAVPTTAPSPPKMEPYPTFTEARNVVIARIKKMKADEAALRLAREIIDNLTRPSISAIPTQPAAEKEAPASQKSPDLYAKEIRKWSARYPNVLSRVTLAREKQSALAANADIGRSSGYVGGQQGLPFAQAAFLVQGLETQPDRQSPDYRYYRNVDETCAVPFTDEAGDVYIFRAIAIEPKRPPSSLAAVKQQVVADARVQHAFDLAGQQAKALKEQAESVGLREAFQSNAKLRDFVGESALSNPAPFSRERCFAMPGYVPMVRPNYVQALGSDSKLIDAIFDLASSTTRPSAATQPSATTQPTRVLAWEQPEQRQWLVVQLNRILPVTDTEYSQQRANAMRYLRNQYQVDLMVQWFTPQRIVERLGWKPAAGQERKDRQASAKK